MHPTRWPWITRWIAAPASAFALIAVAWIPGSGATPSDTISLLRLEEATFSQPYYRRGDEVVLKLHVEGRPASVKVDFSAVDSHFRPATVRVEEIRDAHWVARYRLSPGNNRTAGTYRVLVHLGPGTGATPVTRALSLDYLPGGPGEISVPDGRFVLGPMPRRELRRGLSVVADVQQRGRLEGGRGIDPMAPADLMLTVKSDRRLHPDALKLELAEVKSDGFWQASVRLTNERCTSGGCQYRAQTTIGFAAQAGKGPKRTPAGIGQLVSAGGSVAVVHVPSLPKAVPPFDHTHRIEGTLSFQYRDGQPDPTFSPASPMYPWKAPRVQTTLTKPIRAAFVRLEDECGHDIEGTTTSLGNFFFEWTPVNCGTGTITVSTVSHAQKAGVGRWLNGTIDGPGELTGDSGDYRAHEWAFTFDTNTAEVANGGLDVGSRVIDKSFPAARAFYILDNVMIARAYYDGLPGVNMPAEAPTIGVVYSPGLKPDDVSCNSEEWDESGFLITAFYSPGKHPGFIYIPAEDGCDFGWDAHAISHETSHLFQRFFLRQDPDYGRFGEGLANVQAAIMRGTPWITTGATQLESLDVNSRMACWHDGQWDHEIIVDDSGGLGNCSAAGGVVGFPVAVAWDASTASAGWFQRVVWDLVDGGEFDSEPLTVFVPEGMSPEECGPGECSAGQFDLVAGGGGEGIVLAPSAPLHDVLVFYLGGSNAMGTNPSYVDRGLEGLDLVDLLDGMVCRGHTTVEQVQTLYGAMGFDYDGLGPAGCPHPED